MTTILINESNPLLDDAAAIEYIEAEEDDNSAIVEDAVEDGNEDEEVLWIKEHEDFNRSKHWLLRPSVFQVIFIMTALTVSTTIADATKTVIQFKLACNAVIDSKGICDPIETQILISNYSQYSLVGSTIISLIGMTKFASLSDIYGRKAFITGNVILYFLSNLIIYYLYHFETFQFKTLLLASYLSAIGGGYMLLSVMVETCLSDLITNTSALAPILARSSAITSLGQFAAPLIGKMILSWHSKKSPVYHITSITENSKISENEYFLFRIELIIEFLMCFYCLFIFAETRNPKSLQKSRTNSIISRRPSSLNLNIQSSYITKIKNYFKEFSPIKVILFPSSTKVRFIVGAMIFVLVSYVALMISISQVLVNYVILKFDFGDDIAYIISLMSITKVFALMIVLPFLQTFVLKKWFKFKVSNTQPDSIDFSLMSFGLFVDVLVFIMLYQAKSKIDIYSSLSVFALGSMLTPVLNASTLKFFPKSMIGSFYGAIGVLINCATIVGPILVMILYKYSLRIHWDNFVFLLSSILIGSLLVLIISCKFILGDEDYIRLRSNLSGLA
ncbi:uncharacterized protein KGF55_000165 [Candida pseudojiufengensis]|uniref:uncharacterized protein n=1 Tax=Candida pseudojiufengensis TaxID=497109 RepID=UPI0022258C23|nr:uncharacterized protein KGF55_000165 [Candida pseudojiufengensis]KAI5966756.1 hypothetical protein KGF55_000165 [Candida pseudojiufengensis]